jgi:hypothetical protein
VRAVREQADRLTIITRWKHFVPDHPVLVQAGETIWVEDGHLFLQRNDRRLVAYPGSLYRRP